MKFFKSFFFSLFIFIELCCLLSVFLLFIVPVIDSGFDNYQFNIFCVLLVLSIVGFVLQYILLKKHKVFFNILLVIIPIIIFSICFSNKIINRFDFNNKILKGKDVINSYLVDKYGNDNYSIKFVNYYDGCHVICTDSPEWIYDVSSSVLSNFSISLDYGLESVISDNFDYLFIEKNDLFNLYSKQLMDEFFISSSISLSFTVDNFRYSSSSISSLIDSNNFVLSSIKFKIDNFNEDEFIEIIKNIYNIDKSNFSVDNMITFYICDSSDRFYIHGYIINNYDSISVKFESYDSSFESYERVYQI